VDDGLISRGPGQGLMGGSCEHGRELLVSTKEGISWQAEQVLASEEGYSFMEFFNVMLLYVAGLFGSYRIGPNF
jgi:hypothetical protein